MVSKPRRTFKHPIPVPAGKSEELRPIDGGEMLRKAGARTGVAQIPWNGYTLLVRPYIGAEEMADFAEGVAAMVFSEPRCPEAFADYYFRCAVIAYYTNIMLPQEEEKRFEIVYGTGLYEELKEVICGGQLAALEGAVAAAVRR